MKGNVTVKCVWREAWNMIQSVKKRDDLETKIKIDRAIWEFCGNPVNIMDCIGAWNIKIEHFDSIRSMF